MQIVFCELLGQPAAHSAIEGDSLILKSYVMGLAYLGDQLSF